VPHKSATTTEARAEEGRLLYVALTRATDRLLITHASRRHGYARAASPFLEGLQLDEPVAAPPPRRRRAATDPVGDRLRAWRKDAARRAGILPEQLCSGRDLDAIARARPTTADELAEVTSFGSITAHRLAPDILAVLDGRDGAESSAGAAGQSARSTITGA
jgi:DNA helicase-2/ATP-dependent DNA helicase PcrA